MAASRPGHRFVLTARHDGQGDPRRPVTVAEDGQARRAAVGDAAEVVAVGPVMIIQGNRRLASIP